MDEFGGTGKIFLYRILLTYVRSMGMITLATTSGITVSTMLGERTAQSRFSIPLSPIESSMCGISKQSG